MQLADALAERFGLVGIDPVRWPPALGPWPLSCGVELREALMSSLRARSTARGRIAMQHIGGAVRARPRRELVRAGALG